jgi:hypothetical protein
MGINLPTSKRKQGVQMKAKLLKLASKATRFAIETKREIAPAADKACRKPLMFIASLCEVDLRNSLEEELNRMSPINIVLSGFVCGAITICVGVLFVYAVGV